VHHTSRSSPLPTPRRSRKWTRSGAFTHALYSATRKKRAAPIPPRMTRKEINVTGSKPLYRNNAECIYRSLRCLRCRDRRAVRQRYRSLAGACSPLCAWLADLCVSYPTWRRPEARTSSAGLSRSRPLETPPLYGLEGGSVHLSPCVGEKALCFYTRKEVPNEFLAEIVETSQVIKEGR
jgi:hypothetical protein